MLDPIQRSHRLVVLVPLLNLSHHPIPPDVRGGRQVSHHRLNKEQPITKLQLRGGTM